MLAGEYRPSPTSADPRILRDEGILMDFLYSGVTNLAM